MEPLSYQEWKAKKQPSTPSEPMSYAEWKAAKQQTSASMRNNSGLVEGPQKFQPQPPKESIGSRALKNLPGDIKNIGESTINTFVHPIESAKNIGAVVRGGIQSALPDGVTDYLIEKGVTPEARPQFNSFIDPLIKDIKNPGEAFADHPATTFLNVAGAISGASNLAKGMAGKTVKNAARNNLIGVNEYNSTIPKKAAILAEGKKAGYVIPVSEINGGFINNRLEGIAGKAALGQQAVLKNQLVTNKLVKNALSLSDDAPIEISALEKLRKKHGKVYADASNLPTPVSTANGYSINSVPQIASKTIVENLKQARNDAQAWYRAYERSASPDDLTKAKQAESLAKKLDADLVKRARDAGQDGLIDQLRTARTEIAKTYGVERALNEATGDINPVELGRQFKKGKGKVLTQELKTIGSMREAFPKYMKPGEMAQTPGVSKLEAISSITGAGLGTVISGGTGAIIGATIPLLSTPIRNMLLSGPYQKAFATLAKKNPSKALSIIDRGINGNLNKNLLAGMLYDDSNDN